MSYDAAVLQVLNYVRPSTFRFFPKHLPTAAIRTINQAHSNRRNLCEKDLDLYSKMSPLYLRWNQIQPKSLHISTDIIEIDTPFANDDACICFYETHHLFPLKVSAIYEETNFILWADDHQKQIAQAIDRFGALVFSGFELKNKEFSKAFEALTGSIPKKYNGVRHENKLFDRNVYKSPMMEENEGIDLHNEALWDVQTNMLKYLCLFCTKPPKKGSGEILLGRGEAITDAIKNSAPDIWNLLKGKSLTYTTYFLPENSWYGKLIRLFDPSFRTIKEQFNTEDRQQVEAICKRRGLTCSWDGNWAVVERKAVPTTIDVNGVTLFCNQMHVGIATPDRNGWIGYFFACVWNYLCSSPTTVCFDDGTEISREMIERLHCILKENQVSYSLEEGDILLINNATTLHGNRAPEGEREVFIAMGGKI